MATLDKLVHGLVTVSVCDAVTNDDILSKSEEVFVTIHQQKEKKDLCTNLDLLR